MSKKYVNGEYVEFTAEDIAELKAMENEAKIRPFTLDEVVSTVLGVVLKSATEIDDDTALRMTEYYPTWKPNIEYNIGDRFAHEGILYKSNQLHTSSELYPPTVQSSLYSRVLAVEGVINEWEQPNATNAYMTGDKVTYEGKTYISIVDNNVWSPTAYGWEVYDG